VKRAELVETKHPELSIRRQCALLNVTRSGFYYKPMEQNESDQRITRALDEIYTIDPCMGTRRLVVKLREDYGIETNRKHVQRLRREMGIETIWCRPRRTSIPDNGHRKYPYLLKGRNISEADEVWCTDITYIPMPQGHAYLCAVMDWHTRYVLGWAVSNTMDAALTREALENAVKNCQKLPEIFNTDQGSQFTSPEWVEKLEGLGIKVSMDGKGRWMDNVFIERLWRTLKYEDVYLKEYGTLCDLRQGLREWFTRYNTWRTHQALGNRTPEKAYREDRKEKKKADAA
jgi:putative transposase